MRTKSGESFPLLSVKAGEETFVVVYLSLLRHLFRYGLWDGGMASSMPCSHWRHSLGVFLGEQHRFVICVGLFGSAYHYLFRTHKRIVYLYIKNKVTHKITSGLLSSTRARFTSDLM